MDYKDSRSAYEKPRYSDTNYDYPKQKNLILECGCSPADAFFEIDDGEVEDKQKFVLDRVRIDTSCFSKPIVKVEFSSLIVFEAEDEIGDEHEVEVDLLFRLIRKSKGEEECVQSWRYLYEIDIENCIDELEVEMSQPFTVTFCDKPCASACEYIMTVEGIDFEGDFDALRVVKPTLSALAQNLC